MTREQKDEMERWLNGWLNGHAAGYNPHKETYDAVEYLVEKIDKEDFNLNDMREVVKNTTNPIAKLEVESVIETCLADSGVEQVRL